MKFLKILAIIFLVIFALFMALAPTEIDVTESIKIDAHPDVVYAQINNVKNWQEWSPWKKADPSMEVTLGDKIEGVGANYSWVSEQMGNGSFKIAKAETNKSQVQEISMMDGEPFNARFDMETSEEGKVTLSWSMKNEIGFMDLGGRIFGFVAPMMLSESFKSGLNDIKTIAEEIKVPFTSVVNQEQISEMTVLFTKDSCAIEDSEMSAAMGRCFGKMMQHFGKNNIEMAGMPMANVITWDPANNKYVFEAGMPVNSDDVATAEGIYLKTMGGGNYVVCTHTGPYKYLAESHEEIAKYFNDNGLEMGGMPFEIYENDPGHVAESELITKIAYPIAG